MTWWLLAACTPTPVASPPLPTPVVLEGPTLDVVVLTGPVEQGAVVDVTVTAADPDGVASVELHARTEGQLAFERVDLVLHGDTWHGAVPVDLVEAPGVELWVRALDDSEWRVPATWPVEGSRQPVRVGVRPVARTLPMEESFEGASSTQYGHYELGWTDVSRAFRGQRWRLGGEGATGDASAVHRAGFAGMEEVDDWLVSPVISLEDVESAEVRWMERGERVEHARHSLWISTGSADPADGDFVELASLAAPQETWSAAAVVDLGVYVGQRVTLAWRYVGGYGDLWALDDVRVRVFAPDVRIVAVDSPFLRPGTSDVLTLTVVNGGAPVGGPVTVGGTALDGLLDFGEPIQVGALGTNDVRTVTLPVSVNAAQPDNTVVQTDLVAIHGAETFVRREGILVGHPTRGLLRVHTTETGALDLRVGVGDPLQPDVEEVVFQGTLPPGVHSFSVDLGAHIDQLPSARGLDHWWTTAVSAAPVRLAGFGLDFDGEVTWSDAVGPYRDVPYYLPHKPAYVVAGVEVVDPPLRPGVESVLRVGIRNRGGDVGGPFTTLPISRHVDLNVADQRFAGDAWDADVQQLFDVEVTVDAAHTDSTPVAFDLVVLDGFEIVSVPVDVQVPWPLLGSGAALLSGDGVFDPDETTDVLFTIRNDGALATGDLACTLTSDTAAATVVNGPTALSLDAGAFQLVSTRLTANGGQPGDRLSFTLTCDNALGSWSTSLQVDLGGVPWAVLPVDPVGDDLPGASFDLREVRWRRDAGEIALEFTSVDPMPAEPVVEVWIDNPGSVWSSHVVTLSGGTATLFGVRSSGWVPLSSPTVAIDGSRLTFTLDEASMELGDPLLLVAMGTGFCGALAFHCDQWPDDWGNPYVAPLDYTTWVTLTW